MIANHKVLVKLGVFGMKKIRFIAACAVVAAMLGFEAAAASNITAEDAPDGWASYTGTKDLSGAAVTPPDSSKGTTGGAGGEVITVSTRDELLDALKKGRKRVIYIKGIIDMTDTGNGSMIPTTCTGSTPGLDKFIADNTAGSALPVSTYAEWKKRYAASFNYTEDQSGQVAVLRNTLNDLWKGITEVSIKSDTTIIGADGESGIRGGQLAVKSVKNVILRNLNISDCYNPFPALEASDGLNADFDLVSVQRSKYVWVDHCTFYSSFSSSEVEKDKYETKDRRDVKWQVYDGMLDMTHENDFITVSWCVFRNHDKTMLIGNSDSNTADKGHQTITLHHNWFDSCKQRLPMVRFATIHIYNNLYTNQLGYGIDRRKDCKVYSESNVFEDPVRSVTTRKDGNLYDKGSLNIKTEVLDKDPSWTPSTYYKYKADAAKKVQKNVQEGAGAGKLTVKM